MEYAFKIPGEKGDRVSHHKIEDPNRQVDLKGSEGSGIRVVILFPAHPPPVDSKIGRFRAGKLQNACSGLI